MSRIFYYNRKCAVARDLVHAREVFAVPDAFAKPMIIDLTDALSELCVTRFGIWEAPEQPVWIGHDLASGPDEMVMTEVSVDGKCQVVEQPKAKRAYVKTGQHSRAVKATTLVGKQALAIITDEHLLSINALSGMSALAQKHGEQIVALDSEFFSADLIADEINKDLGRNDRITTLQVNKVLLEMKRLGVQK